MTNPREDIEKAFQKLIALHLADGIQPSDLADAVFEPFYESVEIRRRRESVVVIVKFLDADDLPPSRHAMRYTYDLDRRLVCVEQKIGAKPFVTQWSHDKAQDALVDDLLRRMAAVADDPLLRRLLAQLPEPLRQKLVRMRLAS